jgi:hypothetical protein
VNSIRADGTQARRVEDAIKVEREKALRFLAPYSKLEADQSRSLDFEFGMFGAKAKFRPHLPTSWRVWWNDEVPFGGVRKTLRRMWMAADGYKDLSTKLQDAWIRRQ